MVNKLIGGLIAMVVGLALLPVVGDSVDTLTGVGAQFENTTVGSLLSLLPILFVIILVAGTVILIPGSKK